MKRIIAFILLIALSCLPLISCKREFDPKAKLEDFISAYGAEGIIYSPSIPEGRAGFIPDGLIERIYIFSGNFPEDYAIFLNSRPEYGYECALFVCGDAACLEMMEESCLERMALLDGAGERSFIKRSGNILFYSTMKDKERAEELWREIIR